MVVKLKIYLRFALIFLQNIWLKLLLFLKSFRHRFQFQAQAQTQSKQKYMCPLKAENHDEPSTSKQSVIMPQVKGFPVLGTLLDLIAAGGAKNLHKYIDRRHQQLGPIFRENLGGSQDAVFVASASLMRSVFLLEGQYPRHPLPDAWKLYNKTHNCQRGLFFMEGSEWHHNRRLLNRHLLNGNLNWMNEHIKVCTEKLIDKWRVETDKNRLYVIHNLEQDLYRWAIDVICSIMFGCFATTSTKIDKAVESFTKIVHKIFENSAVLMNFPPQLAKLLNLKMWRDFEENVGQVLQQGSEMIDMFVELSSKEKDYDAEALFFILKEAEMDITMIKRIFVDLVIAAGDTTAYTSEWALYLLAQNAELQQNIAKEMQSNDSMQVNLIHGLIKETLRLYPVAPFIGRYVANDGLLGGYEIKKNTLILLSLYSAGRDAKHFENPLHVVPERWTQSQFQPHEPHASLPFAIGIRSCIGKKIATKQIYELLGTICQNFQLECLNSIPIDSILHMVTVPNQQLEIALRPRYF